MKAVFFHYSKKEKMGRLKCTNICFIFLTIQQFQQTRHTLTIYSQQVQHFSNFQRRQSKEMQSYDQFIFEGQITLHKYKNIQSMCYIFFPNNAYQTKAKCLVINVLTSIQSM